MATASIILITLKVSEKILMKVLNKNTVDDTIVAVGSCSLPAFIIQNDQIMGQAEFITDTKVRYRCMDSYRLRGPKNLECKCRGRNCRQQPKKTPKCIKDNDK